MRMFVRSPLVTSLSCPTRRSFGFSYRLRMLSNPIPARPTVHCDTRTAYPLRLDRWDAPRDVLQLSDPAQPWLLIVLAHAP